MLLFYFILIFFEFVCFYVADTSDLPTRHPHTIIIICYESQYGLLFLFKPISFGRPYVIISLCSFKRNFVVNIITGTKKNCLAEQRSFFFNKIVFFWFALRALVGSQIKEQKCFFFILFFSFKKTLFFCLCP